MPLTRFVSFMLCLALLLSGLPATASVDRSQRPGEVRNKVREPRRGGSAETDWRAKVGQPEGSASWQRADQTIDGQTISYLIDTLNPTGYAQVVEELQNGTVVRTYTFGHDLLLQDQRDGTGTWRATWYGYDGHGSVRFLTDGAGLITDRYDYDAFGTLLATSGTTDNRYRYCGEQYDSGLALYYLRARFMNAANGRFWSMDSYEGQCINPGTLPKYGYGNLDPVNVSDPSGYSGLSELNVREVIDGQVEAIANQVNVRAKRKLVKKALTEIVKEQVVSGVYVFVLETVAGGVIGIYVGQSANIAVRISGWEKALNRETQIVRLLSVVSVQGGTGSGAQKFLREVVEMAVKLGTQNNPGIPGFGSNRPVDPARFPGRLDKHYSGDPFYRAISRIWDATIGAFLERI